VTATAHRPSSEAPYRNAMCCNKVMTTRLSKELAARVWRTRRSFPFTRLQFHFPIWTRCMLLFSTSVMIIIHLIYREELSIYNGYMATNFQLLNFLRCRCRCGNLCLSLCFGSSTAQPNLLNLPALCLIHEALARSEHSHAAVRHAVHQEAFRCIADLLL
jgi:hypothetical protein